MPNFKYRAMNTDGEKINGNHEAASKGEVIEFISSNGYYPLMVEEIIESKQIEFKINNKVKLKDLSIFCRQFYTMLDAGVPILTCLNILTSQTTNKRLQETLKEVEDDVEKGGVLSDAMRKHTEVFPGLLVSLVAAGEASGNLDSIMLRMANHYEKENKVSNKVRNAMIYPIILGLVAITAVVFILTYVMPTFTDLFIESGLSLPWSTRFLLWSSASLKAHWFMILLAIVGIIVAIKYYLKTEQGSIAASKLKLKLPVIRRLNEMIIVSRFTRTLSTLLSSGLPLVQALDIVIGVIDNKIAEDAILKVKEKVVRGESLNSSLRETGIFPQMLYSMIKIGEETGSLDDILNKTADFYDEELEATIQTTVALMEPALIVIMGLIIGFIIISIMIPMFDSYNQI
ncbi:type II secretion system F family protein [Clostridium botulinum]|nr:type II secretion system F family protein [Clostridium botulinum]NFR13527.1 type II secretion system F family protein [Clostridium botulinum]NFR43007.1 type II secretion system F family protein [Clostridium botulinum]NFS51001.1 type II secretion system F family protein [Clostridium botulinum]